MNPLLGSGYSLGIITPPMDGAKDAIAHYHKQGWHIFGVSNQGGIAANHKSLEDCTKEMQLTLELFPEINAIAFCPDFEGEKCWFVSKTDNPYYICRSDFPHPNYPGDYLYPHFRKPGSGMIMRFIDAFGFIDADEIWMVGDREEDEGCAISANIKSCPAVAWRNSFLPGIQVFHGLSIEQIRFLEGA